MRVAGWVVAAVVGFGLAATFMDAPARWVAALRNEPAAMTAQAAPAQVGRSLAARTSALEEFADRCATEQWDQAEELRDAAGRAELQGDRAAAEDFDEQATFLYEEARAEAVLRREEGRCLDQSTYQEMPQPNPRDPEREPVSEPIEGVPPFEVRSEDPRAGPVPESFPPLEPEPIDPGIQNEAEASLRSRAAALAARGDPCAAARLLREQGSAQRTLLLAREFLDRCRRRRAR